MALGTITCDLLYERLCVQPVIKFCYLIIARMVLNVIPTIMQWLIFILIAPQSNLLIANVEIWDWMIRTRHMACQSPSIRT